MCFADCVFSNQQVEEYLFYTENSKQDFSGNFLKLRRNSQQEWVDYQFAQDVSAFVDSLLPKLFQNVESSLNSPFGKLVEPMLRLQLLIILATLQEVDRMGNKNKIFLQQQQLGE